MIDYLPPPKQALDLSADDVLQHLFVQRQIGDDQRGPVFGTQVRPHVLFMFFTVLLDHEVPEPSGSRRTRLPGSFGKSNRALRDRFAYVQVHGE